MLLKNYYRKGSKLVGGAMCPTYCLERISREGKPTWSLQGSELKGQSCEIGDNGVEKKRKIRRKGEVHGKGRGTQRENLKIYRNLEKVPNTKKESP